MIEIEAGPEGFILSSGGKRVLSHSRRSPCVEIGRSENIVRQNRSGCFKLRKRRENSAALRSYKIVERSEAFAVIDFEGKLSMAVRWQDGCLRLSFSRFDSTVNLFRLRLAALPDERVFGCGERYDRLDLKGRRAALWVRDKRLGRGFGPSSYPIPAFVSTKDYWCVVDTTAYTRLDFRRAATFLESWAVPREVVMGWGVDAPAVVASMHAFIGKPPSLLDWTFDGAWIEVRGGMGAMRRRLDSLLDAGVKVAALWSSDWYGTVSPGSRAMRGCAYDGVLYPGLPAEIAALRARGIRFLGYVSPLLDPEGSLYAEASARGFCVKGAAGGDYLIPSRGSPSAMIDLTADEALVWFKAILKRELLGLGMAGWLADSADLPADAVLSSGESAAEAHNRWPLLWAKANREAIEESGLAGETELLVRSGWLGSSCYANAFWSSGKEGSSSKRDGLPSSVFAALSLSLSGGGSWHSEAGGSPPSGGARRLERIARWIEMDAFSPLLRVSDGRGFEPGARSRADPQALAFVARMSEIYAALKPYHLAVAAEQVAGGLPPIRHPWMHYEADPQAQTLSCQYLYGRDLMIAPALSGRAGARSCPITELYLPDDEWVHLWTSRDFRGGRIAVESPLGYPAIFYRSSSSFAPLFDGIRRTSKRI